MNPGEWVAFGVLVVSLSLLLASLFLGAGTKWGRITGVSGVSGVLLSVAVPAVIANLALAG